MCRNRRLTLAVWLGPWNLAVVPDGLLARASGISIRVTFTAHHIMDADIRDSENVASTVGSLWPCCWASGGLAVVLEELLHLVVLPAAAELQLVELLTLHHLRARSG